MIQNLAEQFDLTPKEANLLAYLLEDGGYVAIRPLAVAIGYGVEPNEWKRTHNNLSVLVHKLRNKVPEGSILNRRGFGFKVDPHVLFSEFV